MNCRRKEVSYLSAGYRTIRWRNKRVKAGGIHTGTKECEFLCDIYHKPPGICAERL